MDLYTEQPHFDGAFVGLLGGGFGGLGLLRLGFGLRGFRIDGLFALGNGRGGGRLFHGFVLHFDQGAAFRAGGLAGDDRHGLAIQRRSRPEPVIPAIDGFAKPLFDNDPGLPLVGIPNRKIDVAVEPVVEAITGQVDLHRAVRRVRPAIHAQILKLEPVHCLVGHDLGGRPDAGTKRGEHRGRNHVSDLRHNILPICSSKSVWPNPNSRCRCVMQRPTRATTVGSGNCQIEP